MQQIDEKSNVDYSYYNCILHNNSDADIPCDFNETRSSPYLHNIEDYELAVIRFKICAFSLPLFTFEDNAYTVHMTYQHANPVNGIAITNKYQPQFIPSSRYPTANKDVYDYNDFVNMVNIALHGAYTELRNAVSVVDGDIKLEELMSEPVIVYDPVTKFFSISAEIIPANTSSYYWPSDDVTENQNAPTKIKIIFSPKLYGFFNGFPSYRDANGNFIMKFFDKAGFFKLNENDYQQPTRVAHAIITNIASYPTLASFHKKNRFIITTTMPIVSENLGFNSDANTRTNAILSDYELSPSQDTQSAKEYVYYYKTDNYRWTNMAGNGDLSRMDWRIYNQGQENLITNILKIPSGGEVYLKLMFRRRMNHTLMTQTIRDYSEEIQKNAIKYSGSGKHIKY